jgi:Kef-type K+ transport system membrane component KefB
MSTIELYFFVLIIIFLFPWIIWKTLKLENWIPLVVVQVISGILLGPGVAGHIFPELHSSIFTDSVITSINSVAWWAVSLFVFSAGLELNLKGVWKEKKDSSVIAISAMLSPLIVGSILGLVFYYHSGWHGNSTTQWQFVLGIGMAMAVTALPVLIVLLEKLDILKTQLGQRVLRCASLDDILIWAVLAVILMDWGRLSSQAIFLIVYFLATFVIRKYLTKFEMSDRWAIAIVWLITCTFVADLAGLHYIVGAFLAGISLDSGWLGQEQVDYFRNFVLITLMPVFFLSTGLRTDWSIEGYIVILAAFLMLIIQFASKQIGVNLAGYYLKWNRHETRIIGFLLQTKGLIEIIFASVLLDKDIITSSMFTALLLMALMSTVITIPLVKIYAKRKNIKLENFVA